MHPFPGADCDRLERFTSLEELHYCAPERDFHPLYDEEAFRWTVFDHKKLPKLRRLLISLLPPDADGEQAHVPKPPKRPAPLDSDEPTEEEQEELDAHEAALYPLRSLFRVLDDREDDEAGVPRRCELRLIEHEFGGRVLPW